MSLDTWWSPAGIVLSPQKDMRRIWPHFFLILKHKHLKLGLVDSGATRIRESHASYPPILDSRSDIGHARLSSLQGSFQVSSP